jgi:hypothetical protein
VVEVGDLVILLHAVVVLYVVLRKLRGRRDKGASK